MSFPRPGSQHLHSCVRHHHRLLELGGETAVLSDENIARTERTEKSVLAHLSDAGPVVRPGLVPPDSHVNHRLYSEAVARLHHADSLVLGIVRNVGGAVEQPADIK